MRLSRLRSGSVQQLIFKTLFWCIVILTGIGAMSSARALTEQELVDGGTQRLHDFMLTQGEHSTFTSEDGVVIHYQRFDQDCNHTAIVILPGWSEPYLKYAEVIYDLRSKLYCVYAMDYRGQGLSSRVVENPQVGHVEDFSRYVSDFAQFFNRVVLPGGKRKIYLLSHSMGGLVAALYVRKQPQHINGVIMVAPMFEINTGAWPRWAAYRIVSVLDWLGFGRSFVFGHGPWEEKPFAHNRLTHSAVRYQEGIELFRQNEALVIGGVSNRWLKTSMEYGEKVILEAPQYRSRILMFEAQQDSFVLSEPMQHFCRMAPRCEKVFIPGAKHELLMETDAIRDTVFDRIYEFIEE